MKNILWWIQFNKKIEKAEYSKSWKAGKRKKGQKQKKGGTSKPSKKWCLLNKVAQTSRAKCNTSNSNIDVDIPKWIEWSSSEE